MPDRPSSLIDLLALEPHPEGGFYRETYCSSQHVQQGSRERPALTSIYYLLKAGQYSAWHVVASDETWHFYEGDPLELLTFEPDTGTLHRHILGPASEEGARPFAVVPAGCWQAAHPRGDYTLVGCAVGPGFEFEDFALIRDLGDEQRGEHSLPKDVMELL